jgi:hypothetical protein
VGGGAANTAVSDFADRPPTPDPSERASLVSTPPRADARGGRGEKDDSNFKQRFAFSRRDPPEFCYSGPPSPIGGRRECRAPGAPAAACAKVEVESTRVSQVTPETPGIPHAMVYGLLRALPGDRALLPPSPRAVSCARLDASVEASGPHDFAVRYQRFRQRRR